MRNLYLIGVLFICSQLCCQRVSHDDIVPGLAQIDRVVHAQIGEGNIPGAVVLVGQDDRVLYHRAFGHAVLQPARREMSMQTLFDLASLTKPVATASSVIVLAQQGKLSLNDHVSDFLPEYACLGKEGTRVKHLLTHTSGLPAYTDAAALEERWGPVCPDRVVEKISGLQALHEPGERFRYSCLGYIVAARIVHIVSGQTVADFSRVSLFQPLGMRQTVYTPGDSRLSDIAGTESHNDQTPLGSVHDPLAQLMGGVSGNAGLFSTASDLARFCRMLLQDGTWQGERVLSPRAVGLLTRAQSQGRACGFDVNSSYAWIKGRFAGDAAFCHSGYTGTSLVCDPVRKRYVIILTNRVHPRDDGSCRALRTAIADIVFQPDVVQ